MVGIDCMNELFALYIIHHIISYIINIVYNIVVISNFKAIMMENTGA